MAEPGEPSSSHVAGGHVPERQASLYSGLGLGLFTALASPARGMDCLYLLVHTRPEKGHAWGSSRPEAELRVGVKSAGCFPGDELGRAWGPRRQPCCQESNPER